MDAKGPGSLSNEGFIPVGRALVYGRPIDGLTRCVHYHTVLDILSIKFPCCDRYYPCHTCHEECAGHPAERWPKKRWSEVAILCGACGAEHTIENYLEDSTRCPACKARFNPRCALHHHLYFELESPAT